jgi:GAF domain-containing protein
VTAVLWTSIGILALALALALRLLRRSGETRVGALAALVALAGAGQGAFLVAYAGRPLGLDAASAAALAGLAAGVAALFAVRAFAVTLEELELAEALHWGSMQGVRAVTELAADRRGLLDERLHSLLELGCERFGLEIGLVSRILGERYELRALRAPDGFPVEAGSVLRLGDTLCRHTAAGGRPLALEQVSEAPWARPPGTDPLGLEAYLGTPVAAGDRRYGTLVFASRSPAAQRFTASHKDLLALMAQWISVELERQAAPAAAERRPDPRDLPSAPRERRLGRRARPGIDVDEVLRRVERRIRDLVEPRVRLRVQAGAGPCRARDPGIPLESLLLTLVGHAVDAMPAGGTLTLAGASLAGDATPYVTLSVSHTGRGPDAEALARAFDPGRAEARDGLALARLVRALRRGGGDLSAQVDPARGSTFTVFLPATADARAVAPLRAPPPPPTAPR